MTTYQATNHAQMANFITVLLVYSRHFPKTRTEPEPDPKPGFCGLPNPKPGFSKKAPGLESLVGQLNDVSQIVPQPTLVALATKFENLKTKVGYNSACIRDIADVLASNRVFCQKR